jgi:VanZ family protein
VAIVLAYMGAIFYLSSLPGNELASWGLRATLFDLAHTPLYAGLTLVTLWALVGPAAARVAFVAALVLVFALSDEWHQQFVPGRVFSSSDLFADAVGIGIGIAVHEWVLPWIPLRRGDPQT